MDAKDVQPFLLTAAGISEKARKYFDANAKIEAIESLIKNFLEPVGGEFSDEILYRFLLIKGDTLGGSMRNLIGALAQKKLIRALLAMLKALNIPFEWYCSGEKAWKDRPADDYGIEETLKAFCWNVDNKQRVFAFNLNNTFVNKNIDLCLFHCGKEDFPRSKIIKDYHAPVMFGELKGGIDPAGADEHAQNKKEIRSY